jgi:hypothetical protein
LSLPEYEELKVTARTRYWADPQVSTSPSR